MNKKILAISLVSLFIVEYSYSAQWNRHNNSRQHNTISNTATNSVQNQNSSDSRVAVNNSVVPQNQTLPIDVKNENLKQRILQNDNSAGISINDLYSCNNIWPNGNFIWDVPNAGTNIGTNDTCVAIIELKDSNTNTTLATAKVSADNIFNCNIDAFPSASYTPAIQNMTLPADNAPTEQDVKTVMDSERKDGAAMKSIAAAIVGGIGGNLAVKSDPGKSALSFGEADGQRGKKILGTVVGAAAMGGSMYATTQMGTVAGTITETALVDAAGGTFLGNIYSGVTGGGSDFIETIKINNIEYATGYYNQYKGSNDDVITNNAKLYYQLYLDGAPTDKFYLAAKDENDKTIVKNYSPTYNISQIETNKDKKCGDNTFTETNTFLEIDQRKHIENNKLKTSVNEQNPSFSPQSSKNYLHLVCGISRDHAKLQPVLAHISSSTKDKKTKSYTYDAFYKTNYTFTELGEELPNITSSDFQPNYKSASDGGVIDFSNKGRTKATVIGGVGGGALGGFTGYQQANQEITDRYTSALQEYKDSLKKYYCTCGTNFLGFYNENIVIPNFSSSNQ